ncbi:FAD-dependent oxidoreductase [Azospirillum agricola]|uniref:FAD-dependent oxidoreductase n=1 Tax=Azospirillum agricola TaxID=1720247 RepID=UPI000A0EEDC9|nr:FAD-dependent oxidoreductase [Azospirillum agricola]SMH38220.1 Succinate dehydrogenase/fumarate reductase, flavoprotein subunit [Azospirillum lipoferum]
MKADLSADLIVVGGGIAGLVTANRAAELGLKVLVLEKGTDDRYLCNSRFTGGAFHIGMRSLHRPVEEVKATIRDETGNFVAEPLVTMIATEAPRAVDWLRKQGIRFLKAGPRDWQDTVLAPPALPQPGLNWEGRGGDTLLRTLGANLEKRGGSLQRGVRVRELMVENGRVVGLRAERDGGSVHYQAAGVVIADGGFQGDPELVREHVSPAPDGVRQRGAGTGGGDGLRMAVRAGAATLGTPYVYGHILCQDALRNDRLWPYPWLDEIVMAGVVVNGDGERFVDEGRGGVYVTNRIAKLADPLSATVIFDRPIWDGPATESIIPANPHLPRVGGTVVQADTLEGLAGQLGIPPDRLAATVAAYNAAVDGGRTEDLAPPRGTGRARPFPIRTGPFQAIRLVAGMTYTMGGIAIDDHSRVTRADGSPIDGLFAAGATTGGLEGGDAIGYVGGLTKSAVTGLRAAEAAARALGREVTAR